MKKFIQFIFKKFGIKIISEKNEIFKKQALSNPFDIQKKLFIEKNDLMIFDVGAQYGQTALEYSSRFSGSTIYCFEPFNESFNILKNNVSEYSNIKAFNIAIGDSEGVKKFNSNTFSATNSFLETHEKASDIWGKGMLDTIEKTDVAITTLDNFVKKNGINQIDILKIDVQGYEFNVIEGAKHLISTNNIKLIYLEIIIMPTYKEQKHLDELLALMRTCNFSLYNLYNFTYDSFGSLSQLDAIFICDEFKKTIFI